MRCWTCTGVRGRENPVELQRAVSLCLVPLCLQPSRSDVSDAEPEREYSRKKKYASEPRKEKVKERKNRYWSLFSQNSKNFALLACKIMHVCVRNRRVLITAFTKTAGFFSMHVSGKVFQTLHSYLHGAGKIYQFGWTWNNLKVVGVSGQSKVAFSRQVQIESCPNIVLLTDKITRSIALMTLVRIQRKRCASRFGRNILYDGCVYGTGLWRYWVMLSVRSAISKQI